MELASCSTYAFEFLSTRRLRFHPNPILRTSPSFSRIPTLPGRCSSSNLPSPFRHSSRTLPTPVRAREVAVEEAETDPLPADILVTETKQPHSSVKLSVQVPPAVCQDCQKKVLVEFLKHAKVPGFRPGKRVPEDILINYIGRAQLQQATIESILKRTLPYATSSVKGRALKDSIHIVTKFSEMNDSFSIQDFFRYEVVADVTPEVRWLSEDRYKNLKIVVEIDSIISAERACEMELKRRHNSLGTLKIITDRGLKRGDLVVLDIFAKRIEQGNDEGENIPSAERIGFHLDTEENDILPGFLDSILGIRQDETKTFEISFPETWWQENLQGVHAKFTVTCKELFYRELPELDDSVADKLLPRCKTLSEVKESILERCQEVEQTARDQATDNAILDRLCKIVEVEIPKSLFEEQGRQLYGAKLLQIQASQKLDEQQLQYLSSEMTVNQYLESQRENISNIIKQSLAVGEIFKCENLQYSTEELVKEVQNSVAEFKRHNQDYDEERVKDQVQEILEGAKVLEWLRENADIQYI